MSAKGRKGRNGKRDEKPGGEPLLPVTQGPREIRPSAYAISNRLKQAAPANDQERRRSIRCTRINDRSRTESLGKNFTPGNSRIHKMRGTNLMPFQGMAPK